MANFTDKQLDLILKKTGYQKITTAIETGTFEAKTSILLKSRFLIVHTIELQPQRWKKCVELYANTGIQFHFGDSANIVPVLSKLLENVPIFWYLDAHWFNVGKNEVPVANSFPIWKEIEIIKSRKQPDIIVVDDVHAFGRKEKGWEDVCFSTLNDSMKNRIIDSEINGDQYVAWLKNEMCKIF